MGKHKDWESRSHIVECLQVIKRNNNNIKKSARELSMTHQQLRWIAVRAGIKPGGKCKPSLQIDYDALFEFLSGTPVSKISVDRNKIYRMYKLMIKTVETV